MDNNDHVDDLLNLHEFSTFASHTPLVEIGETECRSAFTGCSLYNSPMFPSTDSIADEDDFDCVSSQSMFSLLLTPLISPSATPSAAFEALTLGCPPTLNIGMDGRPNGTSDMNSSIHLLHNNAISNTSPRTRLTYLRYSPYSFDTAPNASSKQTPLTPSQIMEITEKGDLRSGYRNVVPVTNDNVLSDVAQRLLEEKSNYENLTMGNLESIGIKYNTELQSGIEIRKHNHKHAEQRRRDSLKKCFDELKVLVPHINDKNASKLFILQKTCEYIRHIHHQSHHEPYFDCFNILMRQLLISAPPVGVLLASFVLFTFCFVSQINNEKVMQQTQINEANAAPFGTVLGITDGNVEVCSSDYKTADPVKFPTRESYQMHYDGVYTGFRYQCVELARRYLLVNFGVIFESIPMAYEIFGLKYVKRVKDGALLTMTAHQDESKVLPHKGSLLIWDPQGEFKVTGHVAIIVEVTDSYVDIVEQNVEDAVWPAGQSYSRRLKARLDEDGSYHIHCTYDDSRILGWMNIHLDSLYHPEEKHICKKEDLNKIIFEIPDCIAMKPWLDKDDPAVSIFTRAYGDDLIEKGGKTGTFYSLTENGHSGLIEATEELHRMFMRATDHVLHNEDLLRNEFKIHEKLWGKLRKSWYTRNKDIISGRFDFTLSETGVKVYEYNADSASCLFECGFVQDRWSKAAGVGHIGRNSSDDLFQQLVDTWKSCQVVGTLHILHDEGDEETYHALYMKSAAEKAGIKCKVISGFDELSWSPDGKVIDDCGDILETVWKTWSWQTALNQLDENALLEFLQENEKIERKEKTRDIGKKPRLVDVLLSDHIKVYEPLWTMIPACKAILPVLCKMYPESSYLLKSSFELNDDLIKTGYVSKPVTGRGGGNVALYQPNGKLIHKTSGKWDSDKDIYQELCELPNYDGDYVQLCCWAIRGSYAGTVLRVDKSQIIAYESGVHALRVAADALVSLKHKACYLEGIKMFSPTDETVSIRGKVSTVSMVLAQNEVDSKISGHYLDQIDPDTILFINTPDSAINAVWGGLLTTRAQVMGLKGVVINGFCRDTLEVRDAKFPVFCKSSSIFGAGTFTHVSAVNIAVKFGDVKISPGDYIIADIDGVVVVPGDKLQDVISICKENRSRDESCKDFLLKGHSLTETFKRFRS